MYIVRPGGASNVRKRIENVTDQVRLPGGAIGWMGERRRTCVPNEIVRATGDV